MNCCQKNTQEDQDQCENQETLEPNVEQISHTHVVSTRNPWQVATVVLATTLVFILAFGILFATNVIQLGSIGHSMNMTNVAGKLLEKNDTILPSVMPISIELPIVWGDIGKKMLDTGVIDEKKIIELSEARGGMSDIMQSMLYKNSSGSLTMTKDNAQDMLNLFWAFGLANTNTILSEGSMTDEQYGGDPSRFAATGGWTLRKGDIMDHYNKHAWVSLTSEQQVLVESVAKGIYRPCCNNATYFPDCNHGMAMLGLLELLAANNVSETDMYNIALGVNTYWFPSTYETIALFLDEKGTSFEEVAPKDILGSGLSSASGFQAIKSALAGPASQQQGGGGCGV